MTMNIREALTLTKTTNKKQLGKFLGLSTSAVYQWDENNIPRSGVERIAEKLGHKVPHPEDVIREKIADFST